MRIFFARHGESRANVERIISNRDLPHALTEKGRAQAATLAERLAADPVVAIYASPIQRAQETAQIIGKRLDLSVTTVNALREADCGVVEGRGDAEAWQAHDAVLSAWNEDHDYERRFEGGESHNDLRARFLPFVDFLVDTFGSGDGDVLCISHGSLLTQMLPLVLANVDQAFARANQLGNCTRVIADRQRGDLVCTLWNEARVEITSPGPAGSK